MYNTIKLFIGLAVVLTVCQLTFGKENGTKSAENSFEKGVTARSSATESALNDPSLNTLTPGEEKEGFRLLFDGKTIDTAVWEGAVKEHCVRNGSLVADPGGILYSVAEYSDYVLRLEYKLPKGGNNGIGVRCGRTGSPGRTGMEIQLLDDYDPQYKTLHPTQFNGSVYGVAAPKMGYLKKAGGWNTLELSVHDSHLKETLNGTVIVDIDLSKITEFPLKAVSNLVPGIHNKTGRLALAGHGSPVEFRNIRIKLL